MRMPLRDYSQVSIDCCMFWFCIKYGYNHRVNTPCTAHPYPTMLCKLASYKTSGTPHCISVSNIIMNKICLLLVFCCFSAIDGLTRRDWVDRMVGGKRTKRDCRVSKTEPQNLRSRIQSSLRRSSELDTSCCYPRCQCRECRWCGAERRGVGVEEESFDVDEDSNGVNEDTTAPVYFDKA